jgi:hypothetical protein
MKSERGFTKIRTVWLWASPAHLGSTAYATCKSRKASPRSAQASLYTNKYSFIETHIPYLKFPLRWPDGQVWSDPTCRLMNSWHDSSWADRNPNILCVSLSDGRLKAGCPQPWVHGVCNISYDRTLSYCSTNYECKASFSAGPFSSQERIEVQARKGKKQLDLNRLLFDHDAPPLGAPNLPLSLEL